jgi:hypothetical protein
MKHFELGKNISGKFQLSIGKSKCQESVRSKAKELTAENWNTGSGFTC